ncbi:hypothetical protein H5410_061827 [Solanum commersonii]|uniref:Uncharacterized protein n=1 Tax=Solanum commersonii TaxID=4109 RepID=A0A9J5W8Z4_SOLCO|nr:hypothetical protein H5410_061827 [Solanum commersonii]
MCFIILDDFEPYFLLYRQFNWLTTYNKLIGLVEILLADWDMIQPVMTIKILKNGHQRCNEILTLESGSRIKSDKHPLTFI